MGDIEPLPVGVATPDETKVASWAEHHEVGQVVTFETPARRLEAEIIGFSTWIEHHGRPVVRPPDELVEDGDENPGLLVLREEDLVEDVQELTTDGGRDYAGVLELSDDGKVPFPDDLEAENVTVRTPYNTQVWKKRAHEWYAADNDHLEEGEIEFQPFGGESVFYRTREPEKELITDGGRVEMAAAERHIYFSLDEFEKFQRGVPIERETDGIELTIFPPDRATLEDEAQANGDGPGSYTAAVRDAKGLREGEPP